jgi:Methyltransferase domain
MMDDTSMPADAERFAFLDAVSASLSDQSFLKVTLGKYRGEGESRKCIASRVEIKDLPHVRFVTSRGRQDVTENKRAVDAVAHLATLIGADYLSATLFTSSEDVSLVYSKKKVGRLTRGKATLAAAPPTTHNREKSYLVDTHAPFLAHLGVTQTGGVVKPSMYGKFRQICRFVEILDQLLAASTLKDDKAPRIVDVGAGKGYLTFALHEHLTKRLGKLPSTRGIEANAGLADAGNAIAAKCRMVGLTFEAALAETRTPALIDVLIALHACDTATDDAIKLGIVGEAAVIVCAPCCQHEIAPQLETRNTPLSGMLKFGLLKQRHADLVTDAARALLLEAHGYDVRMIEFISDEHTSKNLMIAAVRSDKVDRQEAARQFEQLAAFTGFKQHRLHQVLADGEPG